MGPLLYSSTHLPLSNAAPSRNNEVFVSHLCTCPCAVPSFVSCSLTQGTSIINVEMCSLCVDMIKGQLTLGNSSLPVGFSAEGLQRIKN